MSPRIFEFMRTVLALEAALASVNEEREEPIFRLELALLFFYFEILAPAEH